MVVKLEARRSRLRHLNQRLSPAEDIANIDIFFRQPFGREIFAKRRGAEKIRLLRKFTGPVGIVFTGIVAQRAVRPAVNFLLRLLIALQPQIAEGQFTVDLNFTDGAWTAAVVIPYLAHKDIHRIVHRCSFAADIKKASHQTRFSLSTMQPYFLAAKRAAASSQFTTSQNALM